MAETRSAHPSVTVRDNPDERRYEALDEAGVVAGFSAYRTFTGYVVFTHTSVDGAFEGRGVGSELVGRALDDVRAQGLRVVPQCPFVKAFVERHPEYADLVD